MWSKYRGHFLGAVLGAAVGYRLVKRENGGPVHAGNSNFLGIHAPWAAYDPVFKTYWALLVVALAGYLLFSIYWEIEAKKAASDKSTEPAVSRGFHVFLINVAMLLEILPIVGLGRFLPGSPILIVTGIAIEFSGLAVAIWARRHLGANWSGRIAIKVGHELIRTGPYRRLRHPIYTGIIIMYFGLAIVSGERLALIGFALVLLAYWRKIVMEETALGAAFGDSYQAYRRESWALIPGVF
jgi:protein-S-isoprenylcysteine O-methyltransferase Ste14